MRGCAAYERAQSRGELVQIERLYDVIVRAAVKAGDAIVDGVARGENEHRRLVSPRAHPLQEFEAGEARQPEIQDHRAIRCVLQSELRGDAVFHPIHGEARLSEAHVHAIAQQPIVLDKENTHRPLRMPNKKTSVARVYGREG
jgi:hypothetical protein